ncbi:TPA: hypothetical protein L5967_33785 [Pseudomonas aeruginosa]|nr:hypothetical protein XM8_contig2_00132 [Pseudomonas aeruginosa]HBP5921568.1 hypothetical protein [Pseudomonas aeruginosa]HBP6062285.1 hypothetical protein [Pseudomonas aeruginosa]HBP6171800.1 hypothetical protein [Pseudomonas aeruginosa]HBP6484717.1 hypothetical protein [Pseudomonas aeruginosa]
MKSFPYPLGVLVCGFLAMLQMAPVFINDETLSTGKFLILTITVVIMGIFVYKACKPTDKNKDTPI